jgi:hypothetical protein
MVSFRLFVSSESKLNQAYLLHTADQLCSGRSENHRTAFTLWTTVSTYVDRCIDTLYAAEHDSADSRRGNAGLECCVEGKCGDGSFERAGAGRDEANAVDGLFVD